MGDRLTVQDSGEDPGTGEGEKKRRRESRGECCLAEASYVPVPDADCCFLASLFESAPAHGAAAARGGCCLAEAAASGEGCCLAEAAASGEGCCLAEAASGIGGADCFVATASLGTDRHPDLTSLRAFRDRVLARGRTGRLFIRLYYRWGAFAARAIRGRPAAKFVVREGLVRPCARLARRLTGV